MATIFISHSSKDDRLADRVAEALRTAGFESVFLDHDDTEAIKPGSRWRAELDAAMRRADVLVYVGTASAADSPWCAAEIATAFALGTPIRALQAEPTASQPLLADIQWLRWHDDIESLLIRLVESVTNVVDARARRFRWDPSRPPYPGLHSFGQGDAGVFFGRDGLVDRMVELIGEEQADEGGSSNLILVQGGSGVGKSSILAAGVVPELLDRHRQGGARWTVAKSIRPGLDPFEELALSVEELYGRSDSLADLGQTTLELAQHVRTERGALRVLLRGGAGRLPDPGQQVLLIVDQAEELIGLQPQTRLDFLDVMAETAKGLGCTVVFVMRSTFVDAVFEDAGLDTRLRPVVVTALARRDLPALIEGPAKRAGLGFEPGLIGQLVEETGNGRALPLLAYCLRRLYQHVRSVDADSITLDHYREVGGVEGAIAAQFEDLGSAQLDTALDVLLRMVEIDDEGRRRRRRAPLDAFNGDEQRLISLLENRRLVTVDANRAERSAAVTHEAVFHAWPLLDAAIDSRSEALALRRRLDRAADRWRTEPVAADLLRSRRLEEAQDWMADQPAEDVPTQVRSFIDASTAAEQRRRLRARVTGAAIAAAVAAAMVLGILQIRANARADLADQLAVARRLTQQSAASPKVSDSAALALAALQISQDRESFAAVARSVFSEPQLLGYLEAHDEDVRAVAFAPDGSLASGDAGGRVILWDPTGVPTVDLGRPDGGALVGTLAFNPSGTVLARSDSTGRIDLIDLATMDWTAVTDGQGETAHDDLPREIEFVDDQSFVSVSVDGSVARWSTDDGRPLWVTPGSIGAFAVAVDSGSGIVAVSSEAGSVALHSLSDGSLQHDRSIGDRALLALEFDHQGDLIVAGVDRALTRLPIVDGEIGRPEVLWRDRDTIRSIAVGPDGRVFFTDRRGGARILTPENNEVRQIQAHRRNVSQVSVSPDGRRLALASFDGSLSIHSLGSSGLIDLLVEDRHEFLGAADGNGQLYLTGTEGRLARIDSITGEITDVRTGLPAPVGDLAVSETGDFVAIGFSDGTATVIETGDGSLWFPPIDVGLIVDAPSTAVAVGPDRRAAFSGADRSIIISPDGATTELERVSIDGSAQIVRALAWSTDGSTVYGGGDGNLVVAWDARSGRLTHQVSHATNETGVVTGLRVIGNRLFSLGNDELIASWSLPELQAFGPAFQHRDLPNDLILLTEDLAASVDNGGHLEVWNVETGGSVLTAVQLPVRLGWRLGRGPDDSLILFGRGGILRLRLGTEEILRHACALAATSDHRAQSTVLCDDPTSVETGL